MSNGVLTPADLPPHLLRKAAERSLKLLFWVGALGAAASMAGCKGEAPVAEKPVPVRVVVTASQPLVEPRRYVGVIRARYEADLAFRVAGKVIERLVDVGARVEPGTPIARIDATDFRLSREAQTAELAAARSSRDQAVAAEQRFRVLHRDGHVSEAALDQRVAAADEARARVERAERALALQENQLAYTTLVADRAGVVSNVFAEKGQVVTIGQPVARVADLSAREAVVAIPEHRVADLAGAAATLELWSAPGKRYAAHLRELSPEADRAARTFEARFTITAPDADIALGRTANVTVTAPAARDVVRLPISAVTSTGDGAFVWVVRADGRTLERRAVDVTAYGADAAFVARGLTTGERVVALGVHKLDPAKTVRIVEELAAAEPQTAR